MPYTIGADLLPEEKDGLKGKLEPEDEQRLTTDIMEVYDRLLPSAESDDRRRQLVNKLEKLFNDQWPGSNIKVNVFGSSGNKLCSSDSDGMPPPEHKKKKEKSTNCLPVDICITTTNRELEHVCLLAEVLARRTYPPTISSPAVSCFLADNLLDRWHGTRRVYIPCQGAHREDLGS